MSNAFPLKQFVSVQVVKKNKASKKADKLKEPVICVKCGNKRFWVIRCEYCGYEDQCLEEKTNGKFVTPFTQGPVPSRSLRQNGAPPRDL